MFGKRTRLLEAAAIDHHVRLMALEVLLPFAMAGRVPDGKEVTDAVLAHPDIKQPAVRETILQAFALIEKAQALSSR
jgi:hypothetical protein